MCLGSPFAPIHNQILYELHGFRRVGFYAIIQLIFTLIGVIIIIAGNSLFGTDLLINIIIGALIIVIFNLLPNGRPFFLNFYRMGRVYIVFDGSEREVLLISTRLSGFMKSTHKVISSYSQFRGIATHHKSKQILFLCKREESLLIKRVGEILPTNKESIQSILEEISLYWFSNRDTEAFFGVTYVDFDKGIVAENNVQMNINYDFYLKRSDTWKPKNNMLDDNKGRKHHDVQLDNDQYIGNNKSRDVGKFNSYNGASIDLASDDHIVVDYV
eukprot:485268_1